MAATKTVYQLPLSHNSLAPRHGVVTLFGYGIQVRVDCGHLVLMDGIGADRREVRLPRVRHGLKRLVCISEDGFITLGALKWLSDVGVSFTMLDRMGKVLFVTGPTAPSDARLRLAQARALSNGTALAISKDLISAKLRGQETLTRDNLKNSTTADAIARFRVRLDNADHLDSVRTLEAYAAVAYWNAWRDVPILWPKSDLRKVPAHWRVFGTRASPLSGGPRLAVCPPGAILNYCFAVCESEARSALAILGIDPGIGFLHLPRANRDSLVFDLMEPVRPDVERWLYQWLSTEPLRRADFFETATGNCRLMSHLCTKLSETAPIWGKLVAPWAEYVARTLWATTSQSKTSRLIATRLTQQHRREAKGRPSFPVVEMPKPEHVCRGCGQQIQRGKNCLECAPNATRENFDAGRKTAQRPEFLEKRSATQRRHKQAIKNWKPSDFPAWLTRDVYMKQIQPSLACASKSSIRAALGVSEPYAADIRAGRRRPHPRHWQALAQLVGVQPHS